MDTTIAPDASAAGPNMHTVVVSPSLGDLASLANVAPSIAPVDAAPAADTTTTAPAAPAIAAPAIGPVTPATDMKADMVSVSSDANDATAADAIAAPAAPAPTADTAPSTTAPGAAPAPAGAGGLPEPSTSLTSIGSSASGTGRLTIERAVKRRLASSPAASHTPSGTETPGPEVDTSAAESASGKTERAEGTPATVSARRRKRTAAVHVEAPAPTGVAWYKKCDEKEELLTDPLPYDCIMSQLSLITSGDQDIIEGYHTPNCVSPLRYFEAKYTRAVNTAFREKLNTPGLKALDVPTYSIKTAGVGVRTLIELVNKKPLEPVSDELRRMIVLESALVKELGQEFTDLLVYRVTIVVNPAVWHREKTSGMLRDLHPAERESFKFIRANMNLLGTDTGRLHEQLENSMQRGNMYDVNTLFKRMAETLPGFADIATRIKSARGRRHLVLI
ncbi:MAG: hypothetical protein FD187_3179, partial [bacterium]